MADLQQLMERLTVTGPVKVEDAKRRRIRGLFNGKYVFDTLDGVYVWEHKFCIAFAEGVLEGIGTEEKTGRDGSAVILKLVVGSKSTDRVIVFPPSHGSLSNLVRVEFKSIDAWFAEDEQIYVHPKDPYSRIECIPSSRTIRVEVDDEVVAESSSNIFLYETHLRPRYYISPTSVNWELLSVSETTSFCPYKGEASYYNVKVKEREIRDAIWWYKYPLVESYSIAGLLCFYNEKVDIYIDGVKE